MGSDAGSDFDSSCDDFYSNDSNEKEGPEIERVHEGSTRTEIPLIPNSRLSKEFRQHLETCRKNPCPGIFPEGDWNDSKRKKKPAIVTIDPKDISIIWQQVQALIRKKGYKEFSEWMRLYYYLSTCVLSAKLDCLKDIAAHLNPNQALHHIIIDAKRMVTFQCNMMKEMMHRYTEVAFKNLKKRGPSSLSMRVSNKMQNKKLQRQKTTC